MTFLPIVARELLEAARRRGTYWLRLGAAAAGLIVGAWILIIPGLQTPQTLGITMFVALAVVTFVYCLFIGVFRTADCLSEEKREGTLGLLFLTDLKGYDIVLGKLVATSVNAFYGVLALFPVMAIPLLVGGVTVQEFWRVVLVALNMMFFSMAAGMFASAVSRDERRAMALAFGMVLVLTAGFPAASGLLRDAGLNSAYAELLFIPSPGYAAVLAFDANYRAVTPGAPGTAAHHFVQSVVLVHALGWLCLAVSSWVVPRTWQDRVLGTALSARRRKLREWLLGSPAQRERVRRRLLELNPVYWLAARWRTKVLAIWAMLIVGVLTWVVGLARSPSIWRDETAYVFTSIIAHLVLKIWLATEASRRFSLDRQSGALELIVSTPLAVREIVRGQMMALERQFGGPMLVVLAADFIFLLAGQRSSEWVTFWVTWMAILVADLLALSWVGMWRGLNSRRPNRAAVAAMARLLALPWMIFLGLVTLVVIGNSANSRMFDWNSDVFILCGGIISLGIDAAFALPARRRLLTEFRSILAERFDMRGRR